MFLSAYREIAPRVSGQRAWNRVAEIAGFHRIQGSPGYRAAARHVASELEQSGLVAEVLSYPADSNASYWTARLFGEWDATEAELWLIQPGGERLLASFAEQKMSLIQRSCATAPGGVEGELVVLPEDPSAWTSLDLTGKFALVGNRGWAKAQALAVSERGPLGIVTDRMAELPPVRTRLDVPDALQYTSFWWTNERRRAFGFVVSPREGERLRALCAAADHDAGAARPRLRARVSAREYPGAIENVTCLIPGETAEEVLLVAHLCHPQPSANDNASGSGALIEVATVLGRLISEGRLPRPRRSIRLLWVAEYTSTYAYLATHEGDIGRIVAGLNLDMVGEHQDLCKSTLNIERPPRACASFAADLLARIAGEVAHEAHNLSGSASYGLFRWAVTPYSGGSDHDILADPTVGIPCPMLIQWPDRYYHTSQDTLDKVDPEMLRRVATMTATYAYFLARAGYGEAVWLANELAAGFASELHVAASDLDGAIADAERLPDSDQAARIGDAVARIDRRLVFLFERRLADVESIRRLVPQGMCEPFATVVAGLRSELLGVLTSEQCRLRSLARTFINSRHFCDLPLAARALSAADHEAAGLVPRRLFRGPLERRTFMASLSERAASEWEQFAADHPQGEATSSHAMYWADGERTLLAIADLVENETGKRDTQFLVRLFTLLSEQGLVALQRI